MKREGICDIHSHSGIVRALSKSSKSKKNKEKNKKENKNRAAKEEGETSRRFQGEPGQIRLLFSNTSWVTRAKGITAGDYYIFGSGSGVACCLWPAGFVDSISRPYAPSSDSKVLSDRHGDWPHGRYMQ